MSAVQWTHYVSCFSALIRRRTEVSWIQNVAGCVHSHVVSSVVVRDGLHFLKENLVVNDSLHVRHVGFGSSLVNLIAILSCKVQEQRCLSSKVAHKRPLGMALLLSFVNLGEHAVIPS